MSVPIRSAGYLPDSLAALATSQGAAEVAVVDVAPALVAGADPAANAEIGELLFTAFRRTGFAVITGHGVAPTLFHDMMRVSETFFALPEQEKLQVGFPAPEVIRGYEPVPPTLEEVRSSNAMECLLINRLDDPGDFALGSAGQRLWRWPNLWPSRPPELRAVWESYYREMDALGQRLLALIAPSLGLPAQWFADKFDRHFNNLAVNHYPPQPDPGDGEAVMRNRPHTDHGALTLLYRPSEPGGLEVFADGGWRTVPFLPGSLVINVGDMLERWSGGVLPATAHRVIAADGGTASVGRYSIAYFQQPNPDAVIEPAVAPTSDASARYRPVRAGEHISGKELGVATLRALGL